MHRTSAALLFKKAVANSVQQHYRDSLYWSHHKAMPITLNSPEEAVKLSGLKWVCCECLTVNRPNIVDCSACGKQRWAQLAFTRPMAVAAAAAINDEGHGL